MTDEEKAYDEALEKFLNSDQNGIYVKAEQIDVRVHLIGLFSGLIKEIGADETIEDLRKIEQYVRYG